MLFAESTAVSGSVPLTPLSATADFHHSLDGIAFGVNGGFAQAAVFSRMH
jgi:hypothetical protein